MMKILHVSDLHARPAWYQWLVEESSRYDLVCLTGDILNLGDVNGVPDEQIHTVLTYLKNIKAPLACVSGNHDLLPYPGYDTAQWLEPLRGEDVFLDRSVFWFRDYKFRCVPWCDPVPQNTKEDFWLMHAPPFGARTSTVPGGVSHGCSELRDTCLKGKGPLFVLSGHVHDPLGFWTILHHTISLNPGQGNHRSLPNHIVIDLTKNTVTHYKATLTGIKPTTFSVTI